MKYQFEDTWNEDTDIKWWAEGRKKLNKVINIYNQWQIDGKKEDEKRRVLAHIEMGIQTFGKTDGGEEWLKTLIRMKDFVTNE